MSENNQARPEASELLKAATCLSINIGGALTELAKAQNRLAAAMERFGEVYLYCNQPEEGEEGFTGQSLSDTPGRGMR